MKNTSGNSVLSIGGRWLIPAVLTIFLSVSGGSRCAADDIIDASRRTTWAPGVPGGIPARTTIWCDVTKSIPGYTGALANPADDGADDWGPLSFAISHCPAGQVVYIPPGTYRISGELPIRGPITVRGAGMGKTIIKVDTTFDSQAFFIQAAQPYFISPMYPVASGATKGSTQFSYGQPIGGSNNPYVQVGLPMVLMQQNPPALVNIRDCTWASDNYCSYAMAQVIVPTAIGKDASGNGVVTFNPPLYMDMSNNPQTLCFGGLVSNAGVEELTVNHVKYYGGGSASIAIQMAMNCWVKNVEIIKSPKSGIKLMDSYGCEVRGCYVHGAWNTEGGSAYGFHIFGFNSAHLIEDNIGEDLRHTFVFEGGGNGCVLGYNYSRGANTTSSPGYVHDDLITHGAHPFMNLFEGNVAHKWIHDWVHGSSSDNTGFRNHFTAGLEPDAEGGGYEDITGAHFSYQNAYWAAGDGNWNYYENAVGNVLGWPTMTPSTFAYDYTMTAPTFGSSVYKLGYADDADTFQSDMIAMSTYFRHGNYDYVTNGVIWDPSNSNHTIPNSLYLTAKPSFFGTMHWPAFGPDQTPIVSPLPAQVRWQAIKAAGTTALPAPKNLHIVK